MKRELKIGIFISIALSIVAAAVFVVGDLSVLFRKPGYSLYVSFDTAAGLEKRAVVKTLHHSARRREIEEGFVSKRMYSARRRSAALAQLRNLKQKSKTQEFHHEV